MVKVGHREAETAPGAEPIDAEQTYSASGRLPLEGFMIREVRYMLCRTVKGGQESNGSVFLSTIGPHWASTGIETGRH